MQINSDQLITLIRARPSLYNYKLKEYSRKFPTDRLWDEIATEINAPAMDCRMKWHNLRCSYSRYLREITTGRARKKWRLADSMSFLNEYLGQNKKCNLNNTDYETNHVKIEEEEVHISEQTEIEGINLYTHESRSSSDSLRPSTPFEERFETKLKNYYPMPESQEKECYSPLLNLFKGLLPDIKKLSPTRQRTFRLELVELVNKLADEEESENTKQQ